MLSFHGAANARRSDLWLRLGRCAAVRDVVCRDASLETISLGAAPARLSSASSSERDAAPFPGFTNEVTNGDKR